jgi:transcriptional regulator with XRE-family HTH domain
MTRSSSGPGSELVPQTTYRFMSSGGKLWPMSGSGHFIKQWRKHRGLTQDQLAERIGIDRAYLSKIESGKRRYDQPFLEAAAVVLQCEPADLLMRDPSDPDGIWSIWDQLRPVERSQVVEIAKTLKRTGTEG